MVPNQIIIWLVYTYLLILVEDKIISQWVNALFTAAFSYYQRTFPKPTLPQSYKPVSQTWCTKQCAQFQSSAKKWLLWNLYSSEYVTCLSFVARNWFVILWCHITWRRLTKWLLIKSFLKGRGNEAGFECDGIVIEITKWWLVFKTQQNIKIISLIPFDIWLTTG